MKAKHFLTGAISLLLVLCITLSGAPDCVYAMTVLDVPSTATDCTTLGVYGSYFSQAQEALDKINAIRKDACESGNVPNPIDNSRMLTPDDYTPVKWSRDLESIARIRAAEASIGYAFMDSGHNRLNGASISSLSYNGVTSSAENLSFYYNADMIEGILMWYMEKKSWVEQDYSQTTGHYTALINPAVRYIGLGGFESTVGHYPDILAAELSYADGLDETMQDAPSDVMQKIEVSNQYIDGYVLEGETSLDTDTVTTLTPKLKLVRNSAVRYAWALDSFTFTSSDPRVAAVSENGVVTALRSGTATVTASADGTVKASAVITVTCKHPKTLSSHTPPTCSREGLKTYYCGICDAATTESIPTTAHDYVYGSADASGKCTGVCSVCKDTIRIVPPTGFQVLWKNILYPAHGFLEAFPNDNPTGSTLYCWPSVKNGDSGYQDMVIETSDASIVSVPEDFQSIPYNELKILGTGTVTLTIYPKYNARLKKTFTVKVGDYERPVVASTTQNGLSYTIRQNADGSRNAYVGAASTGRLTGEIKVPHSITIGNTSYEVTALEKNAFAGQSQITTLWFPKTLTKIHSGAFTNCTGLKSITFMSRTAPAIQGDIWSGVNASSLTIYIPLYPSNYGFLTASIDANFIQEATCSHILKYHAKKAATCEDNGNIAYYECTECEHLFTDAACTKQISWSEMTIEPLGHSWNTKYTIDRAPTSYLEGEKSIHCKRCNYRTKITEIPVTRSVRPKVGDTFTWNGLKYKILTALKGTNNYTVSCIGAVSKNKTTVKIPNLIMDDEYLYEVTQIGKKAFYKNKKLKSVSLGANLTDIKASAFSGCTSLKKIVIPKSIKRIGASAFYKCSSLKSVKIKSSLLTKSSVGKKAFSGISKKASVSVPSKVKSFYKTWCKSRGLILK